MMRWLRICFTTTRTTCSRRSPIPIMTNPPHLRRLGLASGLSLAMVLATLSIQARAQSLTTTEDIPVVGSANMIITDAGVIALTPNANPSGTDLAGQTLTIAANRHDAAAPLGIVPPTPTPIRIPTPTPTETPTPTPIPTCAPPPAEMVSWWAAENDANDIYGPNSGTTVNDVAFVVGKVGQAFDFNGVDQYVSVPDSTSLAITGDLTIDAWIRQTDNSVDAGFQSIVSK